MAARLVPIGDPSDFRLPAIRALFEEAFPPSERKPTAFLADVIRRRDYELLAFEEGDTLVAFAVVFTFRQLLDHPDRNAL
jgi:hypothetical protein